MEDKQVTLFTISRVGRRDLGAEQQNHLPEILLEAAEVDPNQFESSKSVRCFKLLPKFSKNCACPSGTINYCELFQRRNLESWTSQRLKLYASANMFVCQPFKRHPSRLNTSNGPDQIPIVLLAARWTDWARPCESKRPLVLRDFLDFMKRRRVDAFREDKHRINCAHDLFYMILPDLANQNLHVRRYSICSRLDGRMLNKCVGSLAYTSRHCYVRIIVLSRALCRQLLRSNGTLGIDLAGLGRVPSARRPKFTAKSPSNRWSKWEETSSLDISYQHWMNHIHYNPTQCRTAAPKAFYATSERRRKAGQEFNCWYVSYSVLNNVAWVCLFPVKDDILLMDLLRVMMAIDWPRLYHNRIIGARMAPQGITSVGRSSFLFPGFGGNIGITQRHPGNDQSPLASAPTTLFVLFAGVLVAFTSRACKVNTSSVKGMLAGSIVKPFLNNGIGIAPRRTMQQNLFIYVKGKFFATVKSFLKSSHDISVAIKI